MEERGIDVLLVSDPANMNYLSGYDAWSFYVHQGLLVPQDGDPIWIGRNCDENCAKRTTWLPHEQILAYSDDYVQSPYDKHPMDFVAEVISDLGLSEAVIGVEKDTYYFTAYAQERLRQNLPKATVADATLLVNWVRIIKTDREIEQMEKAAAIAENAMWAGLNVIEEGVSESTLAAELFHALIDGVDDFGGDYPSIVPLIMSGEETDNPHLTWSDKTFSQGDPIIIELAGVKNRYHSPLSRTAYVGDPPENIHDTAEVVVEGLNAALDAAEPGVTCEAVEKAWRDVISAHDIEKESRIGYSVGLGYPPDWGEHTASLRPGDDTVLKENMTFHMIPGIWFDDYGIEISETFRVTKTGAETLAEFPRELFTV